MIIDKIAIGKLLFHGSLDSGQEKGVDAILEGCDSHQIELREQIAYVLATVYHESGRHMQGIDEYGKGEGRSYGKPDPLTGLVYYGRGIVQLTWKSNYQRFSHVVGVDLVKDPELANRLDIAVSICLVGMKLGMFTGVGLDHYINQSRVDYLNARRVINGTDAASLIAGYARFFERCLLQDHAKVA